MLDRERSGREASPTAGVIDSQTLKAPAAPGGGGYDAAKKVKGRKRHIAVDADGRLLMVNLTAADVQDAQGAEQIIKAVRQRWPFLKHLFADGAYDRGRLMSQAAYRDFVIEIVRKLPDQKGFQPLPRRWVVLPRTILPVPASSGQPWSLASLCPGPSGTRAPWPS
jgi:hypothetical protein